VKEIRGPLIGSFRTRLSGTPGEETARKMRGTRCCNYVVHGNSLDLGSLPSRKTRALCVPYIMILALILTGPEARKRLGLATQLFVGKISVAGEYLENLGGFSVWQAERCILYSNL